MDFSYLTDNEKQAFLRLMEEKQVKDSMSMYNSLVERCFSDCVNDFTHSSLGSKEEGCIMRCCDKFFKLSARVGQKFNEQNALGMPDPNQPQS